MRGLRIVRVRVCSSTARHAARAQLTRRLQTQEEAKTTKTAKELKKPRHDTKRGRLWRYRVAFVLPPISHRFPASSQRARSHVHESRSVASIVSTHLHTARDNSFEFEHSSRAYRCLAPHQNLRRGRWPPLLTPTFSLPSMPFGFRLRTAECSCTPAEGTCVMYKFKCRSCTDGHEMQMQISFVGARARLCQTTAHGAPWPRSPIYNI
jgi:hypothetical protein